MSGLRGTVYLSRAGLVALAVACLVACENDTQTYYPIKFCYTRCDEPGRTGRTHKRFAVALLRERYTAIPAQQDVILQIGDFAMESLTKDHHLDRRVQDQRNWRCAGEPMPGRGSELG